MQPSQKPGQEVTNTSKGTRFTRASWSKCRSTPSTPQLTPLGICSNGLT